MRHLRTRSGRREAGAFAVEGPQAVREAVLHARRLRTVYATTDACERFAEIIVGARANGVEVVLATDDVIEAMAETRAPQGIMAVCDFVDQSLDDVVRFDINSAVVLESASDPGNIGTIIRTADAAGASGVVLTKGSADPFGGKVVRATAGSIFHLPVVDDVDVQSLVARVCATGMTLAVATGDGESDVFEWLEEAPHSICWVFGTEAHGVSDEMRAVADVRVRIPIVGRAESLNVGAAVAVCLFADVARRHGRLKSSNNDPNR
jgi:TrmH family RNA methyltransferase